MYLVSIAIFCFTGLASTLLGTCLSPVGFLGNLGVRCSSDRVEIGELHSGNKQPTGGLSALAGHIQYPRGVLSFQPHALA